MKKRAVCIISGRVQGVFFRAFTKATAEKLGLCGFVENLNNGTVYVEAEGEEDKLGALRVQLEKGSHFFRVERVDWNADDNLRGYSNFMIKYKGFWDRI